MPSVMSGGSSVGDPWKHGGMTRTGNLPDPGKSGVLPFATGWITGPGVLPRESAYETSIFWNLAITIKQAI